MKLQTFLKERIKPSTMTLWERIKVWLNPAKTIVGVDFGIGGGKSCYVYGKFIGDIFYITKVEYK